MNNQLEKKTVKLQEMSCPWKENRDAKESKKTMKYAPLRFELKIQFPDDEVNQYICIGRCIYEHG